MTEPTCTIDVSKFRVQLFNEENYYIWSNQLELILRGEELWIVVTRDETAPSTKATVGQSTGRTERETAPNATTTAPSVTSTELIKFQQRKYTALKTVLLKIEDSSLSYVIADRELKMVWNKLNAMHKSTSAAIVDAYLSKYQELSKEASETVMEYINSLRDLEKQACRNCKDLSRKKKSVVHYCVD